MHVYNYAGRLALAQSFVWYWKELPKSILEHRILVNRDRNLLPKLDLVDQVMDLLNYRDNHKHHFASYLFVHFQEWCHAEYLILPTLKVNCSNGYPIAPTFSPT